LKRRRRQKQHSLEDPRQRAAPNFFGIVVCICNLKQRRQASIRVFEMVRLIQNKERQSQSQRANAFLPKRAQLFPDCRPSNLESVIKMP